MRLKLDQIDRDAAAERLRDRDHDREPGPRRRADRDLNPRRAFQAGVIDAANRAHASVTIEVPCPLCLTIVYAPTDLERERVDCLECGVALLARRGIDGAITLDATEDTEDPVVIDDPDAPAPPLASGPHLAAFDAGADTFPGPPGSWQRRTCAAINAGMAKRRP